MLHGGGCRSSSSPSLSAPVSAEAIERTFVSGDLTKASQLAAEALKRPTADGSRQSTLRVELAKIYVAQGKNPEAIDVLRSPLDPAASEDDRLRRHLVLAMSLARVGQIEQAEQELAEGRRSPHAGPGASLEGEWASTCGSLHLDKGETGAAETMFRTALTGARRAQDQFLEAVVLLDLGVVALQKERYEEALAMSEGAREVASKVGAKLLLEKSVGNAGFAMYGLGDFPGALDRFRSAQREAELVNSPIDQIEWLNNEGLSAFRMGDASGAQQAYQRSLQQAQAINMLEEIGDAHAALGLLLMETDSRGAAEHIREFARISEQRRNRPDMVNADLLQAMVWARTGEAERAEQAFTSLDTDGDLSPSLRWQTEQELARVSMRRHDDVAAERWFRRAVEIFHRQRLSLEDMESTLPFLENGTDLYSDYVQFLVDRGRTDEALTVVDRSRAEALKTLPGPDGVRSAGGAGDATRRRLAASLGGAILVYYVLPRESYLWVTMPQRSAFFRVAGGAEIRPLVEAHRRAILDARDLLAETQPTGRELFRRLVEPAAAMLQPGERVFLVGDGALNELNFETLVNPQGAPHFWIDDVVLTHVPSLRLLHASKNRAQAASAGGKMLLLGDPQYPAHDYEPLPRAGEEVEDVMRHFRPESRTVLTGAQATPAAYREERPAEFRYIHFVAHSTANTLKPLDSAVILSRDQAGTDKLYAREIVGNRLNAELVTISGCYSSGARIYAGEGAVGLAWAFERAGARNVIGALWEVNDASTPALMDRLYAGLLRGAQPDVALRDAKLELLHSPGVFRKPLYWAPFQLYSSS